MADVKRNQTVASDKTCVKTDHVKSSLFPCLET